MTAVLWPGLEKELEEVEATLRQAFKIKAGPLEKFAHLELTPVERQFHPGLVLTIGELFNRTGEKFKALARAVQYIFIASQVHFGISDVDRDLETTDPRDGTQYPVLVGDYLFGRFFTTLCNEDILFFLPALAQVIADMNLGGILRKKKGSFTDWEEEEVINIIGLERASLTAGSCRLSALLAEAPADKVEEAGRFGWNLGMAYGILERQGPVDIARRYLDAAGEWLKQFPLSKARAFLENLLEGLHSGRIEVPVRRLGAEIPLAEKGTVLPAPERKEEFVRNLFNSIARRYDLLNSLLSFRRDKYWRRVTVAKTGLKRGGKALDVCCGTGMLTLELARVAGPEGKVVGVDFSEEMLEVARRNVANFPLKGVIEFVHGNAMDLPFPDDTFDCATIGFGLRNVPDMRRVLLEMMRVVRPGGKVVCLEFAKPYWPVFKQVYNFYFDKWVPFMGKVGVGNEDAYRYLHESWKAFPHQKELLKLFEELGFANAHFKELTGGVVAIHVGTKPERNVSRKGGWQQGGV